VKTLIIVIFVLATAPPFAFYICNAAVKARHVPPRFLKTYAVLLVTILSICLASFDGVDWLGVISNPLRGLTSFLW
jgi:hypothetical protein